MNFKVKIKEHPDSDIFPHEHWFTIQNGAVIFQFCSNDFVPDEIEEQIDNLFKRHGDTKRHLEERINEVLKPYIPEIMKKLKDELNLG